MSRFKPVTEDLPAYRSIPEYRTVLAGTNHFASYKSDREKEKRFLGELKKANHLILEGDRQLTNFVSSGIPQNPLTETNYETLAIRNFKGEANILEGHQDMVALGSRYGCRPDLFGAYFVLFNINRAAIRHAASHVGTTQSEVYRYFLTQIKDHLDPYRKIRVNDATRALVRILHDPVFKDADDLIDLIGVEFLWFEKRLREEKSWDQKQKSCVEVLEEAS